MATAAVGRMVPQGRARTALAHALGVARMCNADAGSPKTHQRALGDRVCATQAQVTAYLGLACPPRRSRVKSVVLA